MVCRDAERGKVAVESVRATTGNSDVHLSLCDVSSLADIHRFVSDFEASGRSLHVLVNNAGLMVGSGVKSADGYEMNFAVNTLGTYAMTRGFERLLKQSSPSRVILVASGGALTQPLEAEDLEGAKLDQGKKFGEEQYALDKRRQLAMAEALAEEWAASNIAIYSMHPGWVDTSALRTSMPDFYNRFKDSLRTPAQGADSIVWLAVHDQSKLVSGEFYCDRAIETKHLPLCWTSYDKKEVDVLMGKLNSMNSLSRKESMTA
jgi:dehydrogenase/reductase SDR family protein 12